MTPEEYTRIRALYEQAMALPSGERRRLIEQKTTTCDPLQPALVAMLEAGHHDGFLASTFRSDVRGRDLPVQIGSYKILRELGRGGMGVVYLALRNDDVFHKVVALKVIGAERGATEASVVQRFKQERQILAGLDH